MQTPFGGKGSASPANTPKDQGIPTGRGESLCKYGWFPKLVMLVAAERMCPTHPSGREVFENFAAAGSVERGREVFENFAAALRVPDSIFFLM